MINDFFDENEPPRWAIKEAKSRLDRAGQELDERAVRYLAWRIVQAMERGVARGALP